ncbi:MAG: PH domain-containing protein [Phycisphaerae bacterium]|nr:PH domain-containing protein [Phycisphaerae bacterium]
MCPYSAAWAPVPVPERAHLVLGAWRAARRPSLAARACRRVPVRPRA